tara:strand:+ start:8 stop:1657 length:1650 start_codon:yes stop_codon:yes gene_type:complete
MAGGLLNIQSVGKNDIIFTGDLSKTFFKVAYTKYSNFGLQKFRIDYDGQRELRPSEQSVFKFKIPRYADLLMDTYLVVTLPDIWSPIYAPVTDNNNTWAPYNFRWIENIGTHMIKEVTITCGSVTLHKFTGEYLAAMVERDFSEEKKKLFYTMSGNVKELNDPANVNLRNNTYPNSYYTTSGTGAEPSIRGRNIFVPLNTWFTLNHKCAFPLVALQYNELNIEIILRPIQELFQVRDVFDSQYNFPYVRPDFNEARFQMYRFLQTPPAVLSGSEQYENKVTTWNADVHLLSTYCFLSKEEQAKAAADDHIYLIKDVYEYRYENVTGTKKLNVPSTGLVSSWMWFLQRNDVKLRNEWSNYTNWPYKTIPGDIYIAPQDNTLETTIPYGPYIHPGSGKISGLYITGDFNSINRKEILETTALLLNGEYRENTMTRGVYDYIEKYTRTSGGAKEGIYCYNFCLNTNPRIYQPSGAIDMNKFKRVELEITTHVPDVDLVNSSFDVICSEDGEPIGVRKNNWRLFDYNYNLVLYEERYNIVSIIGGNCALMYAR